MKRWLCKMLRVREFMLVLFCGAVALLSCTDEDQVISSKTSIEPKVRWVWPGWGEVVSSVGEGIEIGFSRPMDARTLNSETITITPDVPLTMHYGSDSCLYLRPTEELEDGEYTVSVTTNALDATGHPLKKGYTWSFNVGDAMVLYVAAGSQGDGSRDNPFGSIQQAVDSAVADSSIRQIYVAIGDYFESVSVPRGISIWGSLDPSRHWFRSATDTSVVHGNSIDGQAVTLLIKDAESSVYIYNMSFISRDAGSESSANSYGVVCQNSGGVTLWECAIEAGDGTSGEDGAIGTSGDPGLDGQYAGYLNRGDVPGGWGGAGGYDSAGYSYWSEPDNRVLYVCGTIIDPRDGEPGSCTNIPDAGGAGGHRGTGTDATDGEPGANGANGADAPGASNGLVIAQQGPLILVTGHIGAVGGKGEFGCGGGGGGGGAAGPCRAPMEATFPGARGGNGGSGGGPGSGGYGGKCGGSSIGVWTYNTYVHLWGCRVKTGSGGDGGAGGAGGIGGPGGLGGIPDPDWSPENTSAGRGGDGGQGGRGGFGGGGAGGSSLGISGAVSRVQYCNYSFVLGTPGKGGAGEGDPGQDGIAQIWSGAGFEQPVGVVKELVVEEVGE